MDLSLNKNVLSWVGLWSTERIHSSFCKRSLYKLYGVLVVTLTISTLLLELISLFNPEKDVSTLTLVGGLTLYAFMGLFKYMRFVLMRKEFSHILQASENIVLEPIFDQSSLDTKHIEKSSLRAKKITKALLTMSLGSLGVWFLDPIVENLSRRHEDCHNSTACLRSLVLSAWLPIGAFSSPSYELVYAYQAACASVIVITNNAFDTLFIALTMYNCAQFDMLHTYIAHIYERAYKNVCMAYFKELTSSSRTLQSLNYKVLEAENSYYSKDRVILSGNVHEKMDDEIKNCLVQCVKYHQAIIKLSKQTDSAIRPVLLLQASESVGLICLLGFQALVSMGLTPGFLKSLAFLGMSLLKLLLYCWFGNELIIKSESIQMAAYNCNWYDMSLPARRSLRIIMMRAQKPLTLTAGGFLVISLESFIRLLNMSYSFFAVLGQVNES